MSDIDLIREMRPDVPLPALAELGPARNRLVSAVAAERATGGDGAGARSRPAGTVYVRRIWSRRLALTGAAAAAAAAGLVATLVATSATAPPRRHPSSAVSRPPGQVVMPATLTAAQWLTSAAAATQRQAVVLPRPDQYVYAETEGPHGASRYQIWQSVDGSRPGLVEPVASGPVSLTPCTLAQAESGGGARCSLAAGYLPEMPASPKALFAFLVKIGYATTSPNHKAIRNWAANDLGKDADSLLATDYLTPAQRAGLFELMAQTPGFTLVRHAVDAIGRSGVAIAWQYQGGTNMIIFDPVTYAYLGESSRYPGGHGEYAAALITLKIVGTLPSAPTASPAPAASADAPASPVPSAST